MFLLPGRTSPIVPFNVISTSLNLIPFKPLCSIEEPPVKIKYRSGFPGCGIIIADCTVETLPINPVPLGITLLFLSHTVSPLVYINKFPFKSLIEADPSLAFILLPATLTGGGQEKLS